MKRTLALLLCLMLVISLCACGGEEWPTTGLGAMLPKPSSGTVKNIRDYGEKFSAAVENVTEKDYESYLSDCKDKGFTIDVDETLDYEAFNEEGYQLRLNFSDYAKRMDIDLEKPIEIGTLRWPDSALGKAVPKPSSEKGTVKSDSDSSFFVYVGGIDKDGFNEYIDTCSQAGFNVDYDRGDKYYNAYDKNNYYLSISYEGFNIIRVEAEIKEDETAADEKADETENTGSGKTDSGESDSAKSVSSKSDSAKSVSSKSGSDEVSADFKEMMDEYENFMDEYIEFMKKYNNSDDVSGMLSEYSEMMSSYSEYISKINKVDTNSLSAADYDYYIEVTGRVSKKLAEI